MLRIFSVALLIFIAIILDGCDNCSDSDIPTSIRNFDLQIRLRAEETSEILILNDEGSIGSFPSENVIFYNSSFEKIEQPFMIENGIIVYSVPENITFENSESTYFIQLENDDNFIPFSLIHNYIAESECFQETMTGVEIQFNGRSVRLKETIITDVYINY